MESYLISPYQIIKTSKPSSSIASGFSLVFLADHEWEQLPKLLTTTHEKLGTERFTEITEICPAASAAATSGCAAARRTQAVYPTAAPRVMRVLWISQARGL